MQVRNVRNEPGAIRIRLNRSCLHSSWCNRNGSCAGKEFRKKAYDPKFPAHGFRASLHAE